MAPSYCAFARRLLWLCAQAGPPGALHLSPASGPAATLSLPVWTMHWLITTCFLRSRPAGLVLTGMSLTDSPWSCSYSSQRPLCQQPHLHPRSPTPTWVWDNSQRGPYAHALLSGPSEALIAGCTAAASAHQHSTSATSSAHLELADAQLPSAAAQAACLRRKRPWTGRQPPHRSCYPWWTPRCLMLQSQLRQAKLLWPCSPHVPLLERRYQTHLRHSRSKFAPREIVDFSQLLRTNPRKFWQAARLPNMLLPRELHDPPA